MTRSTKERPIPNDVQKATIQYFEVFLDYLVGGAERDPTNGEMFVAAMLTMAHSYTFLDLGPEFLDLEAGDVEEGDSDPDDDGNDWEGDAR